MQQCMGATRRYATVAPGAAAVTSMIFFGALRVRAVNRSRWGVVGSVVCRKVPAGPVKVTGCSWSSLVRMVGQVRRCCSR